MKKSESRKDLLTSLVEKGIISQDKADALKKALTQQGDHGKVNTGKNRHIAPKGKLSNQ